MYILLPGQIVPKARPRVTSRGTFMPHAYASWKASAIAIIRQQYQGEPIAKTKQVTIELSGKHSRRGDLDNIAGACLDALVQSGVLTNDNMVVVPNLVISLDYSKAEPSTKITITVEEKC